MLQTMRKGLFKYLLLGFFLFGMLGLVFTDVQGNFRSATGANYVFAIGREKMTPAEFDNIVGSVLQQQNMPRTQAYASGFIEQVRDHEIFLRLIQRAARDHGIAVNDAAAALEIKNMLAPMAQQAKITEGEALRRLIQAYGVTDKQLLNDAKIQMAQKQMVDALSAGATPPQQMIDDALKYQHEWRKGQYITLTAADAGKTAEPTEEELKKFYETVSARFMEPERRSFDVLVLNARTLGIQAKVSPEDAQKYYTDNIAKYSQPERRTVSQIVTSDEKTAQAMIARAATEKDLQKIDTELGKGLSNFVRGTYAETDLAKEISGAVFAAAEGTLAPLTKSALGYHVLYVEKVIPARVEKFEEVKQEIAERMLAEKSAELLYNRANEADDLIAGGASLAELGKQFNVKPQSFAALTAEAKTAPGSDSVPMFDKLLETAFRLPANEPSQLIETPQGDFLIVSVSKIDPAHAKPLAEIKPAVVAAWKKDTTAYALENKASKIIERLKLGEDFAKIARELGKDIETTALLERGAPADKTKNLPRGVYATIFSLERVGGVAAVPSSDATSIVRLAERKINPPAKASKEELESTASMLARSMNGDIMEQYKARLMDKYDVKINDTALEQMYAPAKDAE